MAFATHRQSFHLHFVTSGPERFENLFFTEFCEQDFSDRPQYWGHWRAKFERNGSLEWTRLRPFHGVRPVSSSSDKFGLSHAIEKRFPASSRLSSDRRSRRAASQLGSYLPPVLVASKKKSCH